MGRLATNAPALGPDESDRSPAAELPSILSVERILGALTLPAQHYLAGGRDSSCAAFVDTRGVTTAQNLPLVRLPPPHPRAGIYSGGSVGPPETMIRWNRAARNGGGDIADDANCLLTRWMENTFGTAHQACIH